MEYLTNIFNLKLLDYTIRVIIVLIFSGIIGLDRERNEKTIGLRTVMAIGLGATLAVIFSKEYLGNFDEIRLISYYIVSVGFGNFIFGNKKTKGVTSSAILLPTTIMGFFCGTGNYGLAILATISIYGILKLKYLEEKVLK